MAQSEGEGRNLEQLKDSKTVMDQQINVARSELKNLRQQIQSLGHVHKKEMEKIKDVLKTPEMFLLQSPLNLLEGNQVTLPEQQQPSTSEDHSLERVTFQVIGHVSSWFAEKRGTPRQPGICKDSRDKLTLNKGLFTNPEHSLEGLSSFSHLWLIFHFHKNSAAHTKAKVSPPRLNGERVGVFGTRSPHRPSPIGLSLVKIEKIEDSTIFFSGVDVVDGTPVLDIKPYIPAYDSPWCMNHEEPSGEMAEAAMPRRATVGSSSDEEPIINSNLSTPNKSFSVREEPDGEEEAPASSGAAAGAATSLLTPEPTVRVPAWIDQPPVTRLNVRFAERAVIQIVESCKDTKDMISAIGSVLREDPRSVYLRERWSNHFYSFLIKDLHVSCKFDDGAKVVTVFQVKPSKKCDRCGEMEWQCSNNGGCDSKS